MLRLSSGLFRNVCREVAAGYPDVEVDDQHIDAMTVHLVRRAADFDVIVAENMFGDILSDLAGELAGSLGLAASLNASEDRAMAQAAHGSAPDIAGQDVANPASMMLSSALLLRWLGDRRADPEASAAAQLIEQAVADTIARGIRTRDLGGSESTSSFAAAVVDRLGERPWPPPPTGAAGPAPGRIEPFDRGRACGRCPMSASGTPSRTWSPPGHGVPRRRDPLHTHTSRSRC